MMDNLSMMVANIQNVLDYLFGSYESFEKISRLLLVIKESNLGIVVDKKWYSHFHNFDIVFKSRFHIFVLDLSFLSFFSSLIVIKSIYGA
jgi:hypothetical protein